MTLIEFINRFGTDDVCRAHLESVRWPCGLVCPACGGVERITDVTGRRPGLRRWRQAVHRHDRHPARRQYPRPRRRRSTRSCSLGATATPYCIPTNSLFTTGSAARSRIPASPAVKPSACDASNARRRKGGVNRRRTVARLGREHAKLAARRRDFTHKKTRALIDTHAGVAVESLTLKGLMRTRLAKSFADAGVGEFVRQLCCKAAWAGRALRTMARYQRSTGVCPACDWIGPRLPLNVRSWACQGCGAQHDRDVAAAQVILRCAVGRGTPEPAAAMPRKRGAAVRGGGRAQARPSHGDESIRFHPANVASRPCQEAQAYISKR